MTAKEAAPIRSATWRSGPIRHVEKVMGTFVTFDIDPGGEMDDRSIYLPLARARALLHQVDSIFSLWKPHSPMSRLRHGEISLSDVPAQITEVLDLCAYAAEATDGWFDAAALPGGIDPTGLVKGWAAQRALDLLTDAGLHSAMVNAAGDIATAGRPPSGHSWRIGIQHPTVRGRLAIVAEVDGAIATSGTYERGAHLFDPRAGRHVASYASSTVTGPDLAVADALATALAVAGPAGFEFIDAIDGYEAYAIGYDGGARATRGFPAAS